MTKQANSSIHPNSKGKECSKDDFAMAVLLIALGFQLAGIIELEDGIYGLQFEDPNPANLKPISAGTLERAAKRIEIEINKLKGKKHRRINSQEGRKTS